MEYSTFNRVTFLYDFIVKYIIKDDKKSMKLLEKYVKFDKSYKIIDIGGGTGLISKNLAKNNEVTILDPSYTLLSNVNCSDTSLIIGSGSLIPIKDEIYDIALLIQTLHHINHSLHEKILTESYRVLNKHGKLIIIDLSKPDNLIRKIYTKCDQFTSGGKIFFKNPSEIKSSLEKIGFTNIEIFQEIRPNNNHDWRYIIIASK